MGPKQLLDVQAFDDAVVAGGDAVNHSDAGVAVAGGDAVNHTDAGVAVAGGDAVNHSDAPEAKAKPAPKTRCRKNEQKPDGRNAGKTNEKKKKEETGKAVQKDKTAKGTKKSSKDF